MFLECEEEDQISPEDLVMFRTFFKAMARGAFYGLIAAGANYMLCSSALENCVPHSIKVGFMIASTAYVVTLLNGCIIRYIFDSLFEIHNHTNRCTAAA